MGFKEYLLKGNILRILSSISLLQGIRDNLRLVVWQPFAISLGLDMTSVGSLESLMNLAKTLTEPGFGVISDAIGRRRLVIIREAMVVTGGLIFLFAKSWHLLALGSVIIGLSMSLISVWNTVIAEASEVRKLAFNYSIVGTCYTGAGLIGTLSGGYLAEAFGYSILYTVAAIFGFITLGIVVWKLPETSSNFLKVDIRKTATALVSSFTPPGNLKGFYLAMAIDLLAFGIGIRIVNGMLAKNYGYTPAMIGVYTTAMILTTAIGQIPAGRLADKIGYSRFLALSQLIAAIMLGMMIYSKSFEWVLVAHLIGGVATAIWTPAEQAWIVANVSPAERARTLGCYNSFRGLAGLPAPIIGGILFDAFGFDVPIAINLILALVDGALIILWVKEKK